MKVRYMIYYAGGDIRETKTKEDDDNRVCRPRCSLIIAKWLLVLTFFVVVYGLFWYFGRTFVFANCLKASCVVMDSKLLVFALSFANFLETSKIEKK